VQVPHPFYVPFHRAAVDRHGNRPIRRQQKRHTGDNVVKIKGVPVVVIGVLRQIRFVDDQRIVAQEVYRGGVVVCKAHRGAAVDGAPVRVFKHAPGIVILYHGVGVAVR
jgi:hypothetical protein